MSTAQPTNGSVYHRPVMLAECLQALDIKPDGRYVDVTFGGGNSEAGSFLERLSIDVRAALEGLQEAVYLNGILGEVVRFGNVSVQDPKSKQSHQHQHQRTPQAGQSSKNNTSNGSNNHNSNTNKRRAQTGRYI